MRVAFTNGTVQQQPPCDPGRPPAEERMRYAVLLWGESHGLVPAIAAALGLTPDQAEAQLRRFKLLPVKQRRGVLATAFELDESQVSINHVEFATRG